MSEVTPNWQSVEVRGKYVGFDKLPISGRLIFTPQLDRAKDFEALTLIIGRSIMVPLVNGVFSVLLPATDDPDITPNNFRYEVKEDFPGGKTYTIAIPLAKAIDGIELASLVESDYDGDTVLMPAPSLAIGTVTRADTASAVIRGNAPYQTLDLALPKGDKGDPGPGGVNSVNGVPGPDVTLSATDVGARADTWTPSWDDVTGKPDVSTPAPHTHSQDDVTGLNDALADKAAVVHTHSLSELAVTGIASEATYLRGDGSWSPIEGGRALAEYPQPTTYSADKAYIKGDVVLRNGRLYEALTDLAAGTHNEILQVTGVGTWRADWLGAPAGDVVAMSVPARTVRAGDLILAWGTLSMSQRADISSAWTLTRTYSDNYDGHTVSLWQRVATLADEGGFRTDWRPGNNTAGGTVAMRAYRNVPDNTYVQTFVQGSGATWYMYDTQLMGIAPGDTLAYLGLASGPSTDPRTLSLHSNGTGDWLTHVDLGPPNDIRGTSFVLEGPATSANYTRRVDLTFTMTNPNGMSLYFGAFLLAFRKPTKQVMREGTFRELSLFNTFEKTAAAYALLARKSHTTTAVSSLGYTSNILVDVDATNLSVQFVVPASGSVVVRMEAMFTPPNQASQTWGFGLRQGTTEVPNSRQALGFSANFTDPLKRYSWTRQINGLTPGAVLTWKMAFFSGQGYSTTIWYGNTYGDATMEVWSV